MSTNSAWVMICKGDKVAFGKRTSSMHENKWGLFGGSLKEGESPVEGAIRELEEETKIWCEQRDLAYVGSVNMGNHNCHLFKYGARDPAIILNAEHSEVSWFTVEEALKLKLHWCAIQCLTKVLPNE